MQVFNEVFDKIKGEGNEIVGVDVMILVYQVYVKQGYVNVYVNLGVDVDGMCMLKHEVYVHRKLDVLASMGYKCEIEVFSCN